MATNYTRAVHIKEQEGLLHLRTIPMRMHAMAIASPPGSTVARSAPEPSATNSRCARCRSDSRPRPASGEGVTRARRSHSPPSASVNIRLPLGSSLQSRRGHTVKRQPAVTASHAGATADAFWFESVHRGSALLPAASDGSATKALPLSCRTVLLVDRW
jgi:hypothetical protein